MSYRNLFANLRETSFSPPVYFLLTVPRRCFFCGVFCYVCFVFVMLSCLFVQPCGHLLGKGWPLGSLVCGVLLCFDTFPCVVLGRVWYLVESISDPCLHTYFVISLNNSTSLR